MILISAQPCSAARAEQPRWLGPCALATSPNGKVAYVACADASRVVVVDLEQRQVVQSYQFPATPTGITHTGDSGRLLITCAGPRSAVLALEPSTGRIQTVASTGHTAMGPVVSRTTGMLYLANRFHNEVACLDIASGRTQKRWKVIREPVALALSPNAQLLVVANHLPADPADSFYSAAYVSLVELATGRTEQVRLPNGSTGLRGVCIDPQGQHAYVTHILSNFELVPSQVVGGWTNMNVLSIIDLERRRLIDTIPLDDPYLGAANPWGVACSPNGQWLCVTHAGTHELSVIDRKGLLRMLAADTRVAPPASGTPHSITPLDKVRRRVALKGKGPRALAIAGRVAVVAGYFSDTLELVSLDDPQLASVVVPLGPAPRLTLQRRGEMLFHDAVICYQHWQSCASCHPDARADALNWDLTNDGTGNPKNTKSMLLAHATPPAMATGVRPDAESAVRAGLSHILFADRPESDAAAIDAYLRSLKPVTSPHRIDGRLPAAARRGRNLFFGEPLRCDRCHRPPHYTDCRQHDVGTRSAYDFRDRFDTPSLVELWRTAPYLHDGRYTTLRELFEKGRHGLPGGTAGLLTESELDDLVQFLLCL